MNNNFEFFRKGDENEKKIIKKVIRENKESIGFDDKTNIEKELAIKRFINKEKFNLDEFPKIEEIMTILSTKDQKLVYQIQELRNKKNEIIHNYASGRNIDMRPGDDSEKFMSYLEESLSEDLKRRVLLDNRLDLAISTIDLFNKLANAFEDAQELHGNVDELDISFVMSAYRKHSKQAESIYKDIKSELLEVDKFVKMVKVYIKTNNEIDDLNSRK